MLLNRTTCDHPLGRVTWRVCSHVHDSALVIQPDGYLVCPKCSKLVDAMKAKVRAGQATKGEVESFHDGFEVMCPACVQQFVSERFWDNEAERLQATKTRADNGGTVDAVLMALISDNSPDSWDSGKRCGRDNKDRV